MFSANRGWLRTPLFACIVDSCVRWELRDSRSIRPPCTFFRYERFQSRWSSFKTNKAMMEWFIVIIISSSSSSLSFSSFDFFPYILFHFFFFYVILFLPLTFFLGFVTRSSLFFWLYIRLYSVAQKSTYAIRCLSPIRSLVYSVLFFPFSQRSPYQDSC